MIREQNFDFPNFMSMCKQNNLKPDENKYIELLIEVAKDKGLKGNFEQWLEKADDLKNKRKVTRKRFKIKPLLKECFSNLKESNEYTIEELVKSHNNLSITKGNERYTLRITHQTKSGIYKFNKNKIIRVIKSNENDIVKKYNPSRHKVIYETRLDIAGRPRKLLKRINNAIAVINAITK